MATKKLQALLGTLALAALIVGSAQADQIFIQQSGTSPAGGTAIGGESNLITDTGSFIVGAPNSDLQNPLLIVVGVYDGMGTPSISFTGCGTSPCVSTATVGTYGLTANSATLTSGEDAFDTLGLANSGGSESFVNWSGADVANGFTAPTSFTLAVFQLDTSMAAKSTISIDESGATNGSFILAYDCHSGDVGSDGTCPHGSVAQTVFTNTGLIDGSVPEPGSLALFAAALAGLALVSFRHRRRSTKV